MFHGYVAAFRERLTVAAGHQSGSNGFGRPPGTKRSLRSMQWRTECFGLVAVSCTVDASGQMCSRRAPFREIPVDFGFNRWFLDAKKASHPATQSCLPNHG
jgi:hypothetical protein